MTRQSIRGYGEIKGCFRAPFLFSDLIECDLWTGNRVAPIECSILYLNIYPQRVVPENRRPTKGLHCILNAALDRLGGIAVAHPWKSPIESRVKWRLFPFELGEDSISLDKKTNKNIVVVWILFHPHRVPHDSIVYDWVDYPIDGIEGRCCRRARAVNNQIAHVVALIGDGIERRVDIGRIKPQVSFGILEVDGNDKGIHSIAR